MTTIEYSLKENLLPGMKGQRFAQVCVKDTIGSQELIEFAEFSRSRVNDETLILTLGFLRKSVLHYLWEGCRVDLGFVVLEPQVKGRFDKEKRRLVKPRLKVRAKVSKELEREFATQAKVKHKI